MRAWPAPAKLNLFLRVTGRRPDGYHELQTVFQLLNWGDDIEVEVTRDGGIERLAAIPGVSPDEDLSLRAASLLQRACAVRRGARITVHKQIPSGAGLGGASSDAATVLHALNALWGCGLDTDSLARLGLRLGADVPVFVHGNSAWAEGVGERLFPVRLPARHYVLVFPETQVATASVFADPDLRRDAPPLDRLEVMGRGHLERLGNDCEPVVLRQYPPLRDMLATLRRYGEPRMTGTGSAFFMAFEGAAHARRITSELKSLYNVRAVAGVDRSPLLERLAVVQDGA